MPNKETLVSREVSIRNEQQKQLKQKQKEELSHHLTNNQSNGFARSVSATNDEYMLTALKKVRESSATIPENLARQNGTYIYNRKEN
jgi:hypothetical protein